MADIKAPNSAILTNDEKPFPLSTEECKPIEDYYSKPNIKKLTGMKKSGPDSGILSVSNKKGEKRILSFFKSDESNYYITVNGPGEYSYDRIKYYTTDNKSKFIEFINKVLKEFSDWCDSQSE